MANKLIKKYLAEGDNVDIEPEFRGPGQPPKRIMAKIKSTVEKYGAEATLTALETGLKHKNSGMSFNFEITKEEVRNDPQFVINCVQIANAIKGIDNPAPTVEMPKNIQGTIGLLEFLQKSGFKANEGK